ncbi:unnamed protein product [Orchesella dallaii]|uniref:F-box domain-containing protein n=1 Tax=Orchesella dallaii TaxID=48710 RepID=A0ABP1Q7R6_9HEXA
MNSFSDSDVGSSSLPFLPPEIKEKIIDCLDNAQDFLAVINSSPLLHNLMSYKKTTRLFSEVFPILLNVIPNFPLENILHMRQVNSEWRRQIDIILAANSRRFVAERYSFEDEAHVESFMAHANTLPGINPFLGNFLRAWPSTQLCLNAVARLIQTHGRNLKTVSLLILLNAFLTPPLLWHLLSHLPNLQSLTIVSKIQFGEGTLTPAAPLPPLPNLTGIDISGLMNMNYAYDENLHTLVAAIILAYGSHLKSLGCSNEQLKIPRLNEITPNLEQLTAYSFANEDFEELAQMNWRLENLVLRGDNIPPSLGLIAALNNFRTTLVFLEFTIRLKEHSNFTSLQVFPKLSQVFVSIDPLSVISLAEPSFSHLAVVCPNLEQLSIRYINQRLTKSIVNVNKIYQMFSKLKRLNV